VRIGGGLLKSPAIKKKKNSKKERKTDGGLSPPRTPNFFYRNVFTWRNLGVINSKGERKGGDARMGGGGPWITSSKFQEAFYRKYARCPKL